MAWANYWRRMLPLWPGKLWAIQKPCSSHNCRWILSGVLRALADVDVGKGDFCWNTTVVIMCSPRWKTCSCLLTCIFIEILHVIIIIQIDRKKTTIRKQTWLWSSTIGHYVHVKTQNSFDIVNSKGYSDRARFLSSVDRDKPTNLW